MGGGGEWGVMANGLGVQGHPETVHRHPPTTTHDRLDQFAPSALK